MEKYGKFVKIILLSLLYFTILCAQNIDGDKFEKLRTLTQK